LKIIVAGGGKVGGALCIDLAAENHDVVLIDSDEQVVTRLIRLSDITGLIGNAANMDRQKEAGVENCDVFIAVTTSDEVNIISAIIAHKLGAKATIARVRNTEYSSNLSFVKESLGITLMVNPELEAARAIARSIRFPSALGIETFAGGRVQLVEVKVVKDSALVGMQLSHFRKTYGTVLVCVVQRGDDVIIPDGSFVLRAGDLLHVTGAINDIAVIYKVAGCLTRKIRSVMIVGGGRVSHYLIRSIDHIGMDICVIDKDKETTEMLAGEFPRIKVINGDGTDPAVLEEQHIEDYDCFVALTGIDEENIVISLYAAKKKVAKIVTKVNRKQLLRIFDDAALQTIVTPARLVSDIIIRHVRAMNDSLDSKVEAMYRIVDERVEALQFEVLKGSRATGIPLKDLKLKKSILITYIIRGKQQIFPGGNDEIRVGDHVIAVTTERNFDEIDDLLED